MQRITVYIQQLLSVRSWSECCRRFFLRSNWWHSSSSLAPLDHSTDTLPPSFSHPRFPAGTKRTRAFTLPIDESWDFRQGVFLQWQYSLWIVVLKAHVATCLGHFLNFLHNCLLLVILTCSELLNVQTGVWIYNCYALLRYNSWTGVAHAIFNGRSTLIYQ